MNRFLAILGMVGLAATLFGIAISGVGAKPLVRNGQQELAIETMNRVRKAVDAQKDPAIESQLPRASCPQPHFDFGLMDPLTVGKHTFEITNGGKVPLLLQGGQSSCKCTLSDLREAVIEPGDSHLVTLTWNSGHAKHQFRQSAVVRTNDPLEPEIELTVEGHVRAVLAAMPTKINLDRLIPSTQKRQQFAIYSQIWKSMEIDRIESTSEHITATATAEPLENSFAHDDEIRNATCLQTIRVDYDGQAPAGALNGVLRIYVRPPADWNATDLSTAPARQTVDARQPSSDGSSGHAAEPVAVPQIVYPTEQDGTIMAEIGFHGTVVKRLGIYGKGITSAGLLELGNLRSHQTKDHQWNYVVKIRGEQQPEKMSVQVSGIPGLTAEITETARKNSYKMTLSIDRRLEPAIYDREQAGNLSISAPGLPGNESLELPIHFYVIGDKE